jgi:Tfp pilus assembly protein PilF
LLAFVLTLTAILAGTTLTRLMGRPIFAPEAWQALNDHDPARAASLFGDALKEHPRDAMLHFGAASAAYAMGQPSDASSLIRTALDLDPKFPEALALQARLAYDRGDADLAVLLDGAGGCAQASDTRLTEVLDRLHRETGVHASYVEKPAEHSGSYEGA